MILRARLKKKVNINENERLCVFGFYEVHGFDCIYLTMIKLLYAFTTRQIYRIIVLRNAIFIIFSQYFHNKFYVTGCYLRLLVDKKVISMIG